MQDLNAAMEMDILFESVSPMASKKVAVVIGRFNPPTIGHYEVFNQAKIFAKNNAKKLGLEAMPVVVVVGGGKTDNDHSKNPLSVDQRMEFMEKSGLANGIKFLTANNAFAALAILREKGYEPIAVSAGTDRIDEYIKILDKYFLTPTDEPIKHYKITSTRFQADSSDEKKSMEDLIKMSNGGTNPIPIEFISGTLARLAVQQNDLGAFTSIVGLEKNKVLANKMFKAIAKAIKE